MMTAIDLMTKQTQNLSYNTTINDAIAYLKQHKSNFVPVTASSDRWQGILTEAVMVRIFLKYQTNPERDLLIHYREYLEPIQLIHASEPYPEVVKKVMTAVGNRVFVIDDNSHVIGCVTARDILPIFVGAHPARGQVDPGHQVQEQLRSDLYLYESFFSKCPFMMHSVNRYGEIQMANQTLHALLGYEYGELVGKTIFNIYPAANHEKAKEGLKTIFHQGFHEFVRTQMVHKDGSLIEIEMVSRSLEDQNKKTLGTITVSRPLEMNQLLKVLPGV